VTLLATAEKCIAAWAAELPPPPGRRDRLHKTRLRSTSSVLNAGSYKSFFRRNGQPVYIVCRWTQIVAARYDFRSVCEIDHAFVGKKTRRGLPTGSNISAPKLASLFASALG